MSQLLFGVSVKVTTVFKQIAAPVAKTIGGGILLSFLLTGTVAASEDWWSMSDEDFAKKYKAMAFSDNIEDQSQVAWMLFARLNQQMDNNGQNFSAWELWPSNRDTFDVTDKRFLAAEKVRVSPHLQEPKIRQVLIQRGLVKESDLPPLNGGEEVTRNSLSYDYIMDKGLNTQAGVWSYLSSKDARVDFPIGAVETKGDWTDKAIEGAYQITDTSTGTVYSLLGLHIMAKMGPSPSDTFSSENPSWFWTTFEFKDNPGLANAQKLITYPDKLTMEQAEKLLAEAGLGDTAFSNYRSNGSQIRYADKAHPQIILGNTTMEDFAGLPDPNDPAGWTAWQSSCHSCHGMTSGNPTTQKFFPFPDAPYPTGVITGNDFTGYLPLDFVWSIAFHAK